MIKGFILAAGIGSRLKPWTEFHPKALAQVGGIPMLQRVIASMAAANISEIIINIHHKGDQIVEFINRKNSFGLTIHISDETPMLLDTGGAITKATSYLAPGDSLLVHNADIYTDLNLNLLIDQFTTKGCDAMLLTSHRESSRQLLVDNHNRLRGWVNHKTGETLPHGTVIDTKELAPLSFNGIHIIGPQLLDRLRHKPTGTPYPIIPKYISMNSEFNISTFTPPHQYTWIDIGKPDTLQEAQLKCGPQE
ncbi:MAG: sugar phosphate nucleotidyltransferase [Clostridiales bacterium]|nr:sugar phosphate nucleotidyltransferase [Clostridiales bacterium]